jgi:hypothetical protein
VWQALQGRESENGRTIEDRLLAVACRGLAPKSEGEIEAKSVFLARIAQVVSRPLSGSTTAAVVHRREVRLPATGTRRR